MLGTVEVFTRPRVRRPCADCGRPIVFHQAVATAKWWPFQDPPTIEARRYDRRMPPFREILELAVTDRHDCRPSPDLNLVPEGREVRPGGRPCACGCARPVTGKGRYATRRCWSLAMNRDWTSERRAARARKGGLAKAARGAMDPPRSSSSRLM